MVDVEIEKDRLDETLDVIGALVDEAVLQFRDDKLHIEVNDPANVGMGVIDVGEDDFEKYNANGEKLGVNINRLKNIIGLAESSSELIPLELDDQTRKLEISVSGVDYSLALIDPDSIRDAQNPSLQLPATVTITENAFGRGIKAAGMVGETMQFRIDDGEFNIEASGDTDDIEFTPEDEEIEYADDFDANDMQSTFSLEYLKEMDGAIPAGSDIELSFGDDMPTELKFSLSDNLHARYVLAPRIQS